MVKKGAFAKALQLAAGVAIAGAGLWVFLKDVSPKRLAAELAAASVPAMVVAAALGILSIWLRSVRWGLMLPSSGGSSKKGLFAITIIGFMINNILPARAGEAVRVLLLWKRNRFPGATAVGSLVLERGIDTLVFLSFFFVPVYAIFGAGRMFDVALTLSLIFGAALVCFVFYGLFPVTAKRLLLLAPRLLPGKAREVFRKLLVDVTANLDWLSRPGRCLWITCLSFAINLCYAGMMIVFVGAWRSFGVLQGMFATSLAALGAAIPLAPGYIGTLHASLKYGFTLMGIAEDRAAALAITYHAVGYVPVTLLGLYYFFRTDLRFRDISAAQQAVEKMDQKDPERDREP